MKFKLGDKVKVTRQVSPDQLNGVEIGNVYTITSASDPEYPRVEIPTNDSYQMKADQLELVEDSTSYFTTSGDYPIRYMPLSYSYGVDIAGAIINKPSKLSQC